MPGKPSMATRRPASVAGLALDIPALRRLFPALTGPVYADAPAGTQVPQPVIDAIAGGLVDTVSNLGGAFSASQASDAVVVAARRAGADLLGGEPDEIVFGANMTTLTFAFSRALARDWGPGDRVVVTQLDHDANVTPWVMAAADRGAEVAIARINPDDVSLDFDHLESLVDDHTRLVAVTACSNAFGTRVDVERVAAIAHGVGAVCFVDAVHLAPHARIEARRWGVDVLVCSAYKFFGPHLGVLWGKQELLERVTPYKVRPAPTDSPGKFETGTAPFPYLAGLVAAVEYLASLGDGPDVRHRLDAGYAALGLHETELGSRFLQGLPDRVRLWGRPSMEGRVPTFAITVAGMHPAEAAARLGERGIFVWAGHHYALEPTARLGLAETGGTVRIGFVHPNTVDEVDRVLEALAAI